MIVYFYVLLFQNERECAYYLRTGQCKFGSTCKYHHPQPSSPVPSLRSSPVYPAVHSSTSPAQQTTYQGGLANWTLSRASFIPSPRWQGPSNYAQLILPQGVVPVPSWNAAIAVSIIVALIFIKFHGFLLVFWCLKITLDLDVCINLFGRLCLLSSWSLNC